MFRRYVPVLPWARTWFIRVGASIFAAANAQQLAPDWGRHVPADYYVVVATTLPVLLLALMVEVGASMGMAEQRASMRATDQALSEARRDFERFAAAIDPLNLAERAAVAQLREQIGKAEAAATAAMASVASATPHIVRTVRTFYWQASIGEVVSLYAIADRRSSAFLATVVALQFVQIAAMLFGLLENRLKA